MKKSILVPAMFLSKKLILTCYIFFLLSTHSFSQLTDNSEAPGNYRFNFRTIINDFCYVFSSPARISKKDGCKLLIFSGITAGLIFHFDENIYDNSKSGKDEFPNIIVNKFSEIGRGYGSSEMNVYYLFGGLCSSMAASGLLLKDDKLLETSGLLAESFVFTLFVTGSLKMICGRERPYNENGTRAFEFFSFSSKKVYRSMPSMHTSCTFAMMTVIARQYDQWWIKIPAYTFALAVAVQRVIDEQHWTSDVFVGGIIGYSISNSLIRRHDPDVRNKLTLKPYILHNSIGITLNF